MQTLRLTGEVDETMFETLSEALQAEGGTIKVELLSHGGNVYEALAIADLIRNAKHVTMVVYGLAGSAAVLILAAAHNRVMMPNAWVHVHEEQLEGLAGSVTAVHNELKQYDALETQWNRLMEEYTGTPATRWAEMSVNDTYLTADQCLALGLVDKVVR